MKKQTSKLSILLLLAVMFAAPGVAAYLFYKNPSWLGASRVNKGTLLTPPVALDLLGSAGKWRIVLLSSEGCDQACIEQLNVLARVRVALGRKFYQVDEWLLLGEDAPSITEHDASLLNEQSVQTSKLSAKDKEVLDALPQNMHIFIANPDNYLVLGYQLGANPDDVYKDLKLLLNTKETKSGSFDGK